MYFSSQIAHGAEEISCPAAYMFKAACENAVYMYFTNGPFY